MRARLLRFGAWMDRHPLACRLSGLAGVVALAAVLSISAERQRALVTSYHALPTQKSFREAVFWYEDERSLREWQERQREWVEHGEAEWKARLRAMRDEK
ncbi:MAG: hypothetical protein ACM30I_01380 [Gemmatimonas sp.]